VRTQFGGCLKVRLLSNDSLSLVGLGNRYNFTVDSKNYPYVPYIIDTLIKGERRNLSSVVCRALTEHFERNGLLIERLARERFAGAMPDETLQTAYESTLPSIAEPISNFQYEYNRPMYHFMPDELLTHAERVGHSLVEGVDKNRKHMKDDAERYGVIDKLKSKEELIREKIEKEERLFDYMAAVINKQQRSPYLRRQIRIKELQDEIHKLTKQNELENEQVRQQTTQTANEIHQQ